MRMQRVELSIRQFPPSSFLSCFLFSQFPLIHIAGHICSHFNSSAFVSLVTQLIHWTAAPLCTVFPIFLWTIILFASSATGAVFRHERAPLSGSGGGVGWGGILTQSQGCCVVPQNLEIRGKPAKAAGGWEAGWQAEGVEANEGWRGSGEEWLCRLLVLWSCCSSVGCVSFRHSPAFPRHEPRSKGVLLHAQLLCKCFICFRWVCFRALLSLSHPPVCFCLLSRQWRVGVLLDTRALQLLSNSSNLI